MTHSISVFDIKEVIRQLAIYLNGKYFAQVKTHFLYLWEICSMVFVDLYGCFDIFWLKRGYLAVDNLDILHSEEESHDLAIDRKISMDFTLDFSASTFGRVTGRTQKAILTYSSSLHPPYSGSMKHVIEVLQLR
ncbi:hypothetical protein F511_29525 [Dorcoceras hygrometricum]|uniref:Uncharacterized protein n=1 Tax=Dorcoceras hygrometricum TaxID=472368 RepID=A0A2Z7D4J0_9LAMI|nr:hypothetical protein F511_29525 [Dorcoceras hygrometricum]